MLAENEIVKIADYFRNTIQTIKPLGDEYFYNHLPLCVIDAVWSIGVRYEGVKNAVKNYCAERKIVQLRDKNLRDSSLYPETLQQESISDFLKYSAQFSFAKLAGSIFKNRQRTSTTNGILKAEAVIRFAKVLSKYHVDYFQDVSLVENNLSFKREIKAIPGQKSEISLDNFFLLTGNENKMNPTRMTKRFLANAIGKNPDAINTLDAQAAFQQLFKVLNDERIQSVRHLDNIIWDYQRSNNG